MKPLELKKDFLQKNTSVSISKIAAAKKSSCFLNFKSKQSTVPYFFDKKISTDFFILNIKLKNLCVLFRQKKTTKNKKNVKSLENILKKKFAFSLKKPLYFIKTISKVFNKAIQKCCLWTKANTKQENILLTSAIFKKSKKVFLSKAAFPINSSLIFDTRKNQNKELKIIQPIKNQEKVRWLHFPEGSSSLANQKRWANNTLYAYPNLFKNGEFFGGFLIRADWVLNRFIEQLGKKKMKPRTVMNQQINDIRILIDKMGSECPIKGMQITITGRLGSRKKAMAQQISKCVGKVPLSTFRQKVDYKQDVLSTKFGLIGIKIWICYSYF